jgi:hypothetical protein
MSMSIQPPALSWRECLDLSIMSEEELADLAIRRGELNVEGAELEHYLVMTPDGRLSIRRVLAEDLGTAAAAGDVRRSGTLKQVLLRFMQIYTARAA